MIPIVRDTLRIAAVAALWLSAGLYRLGWSFHHRAARLEDWGTQGLRKTERRRPT